MAAGKSSKKKTKKKRKQVPTKTKKKPAAGSKVAKKKAPVKKAIVRKKVVKKAVAKKTSARKAPAKKAPPRKAPPRRPAERVVKKKVRTAANTDPATLGVSPIYLKAIADYEKAMAVFHEREFTKAEAMFEKVIAEYPSEGDLGDRARAYANMCRRQSWTEAQPKGFDDHYYRGVLLSNRGDHDGARAMFEMAVQLQPDSGKAHYAVAACHAQVGDVTAALDAIRRAVELDPDGRLHARNDDDFLPLKGMPEFDEIVGPAQAELVE